MIAATHPVQTDQAGTVPGKPPARRNMALHVNRREWGTTYSGTREQLIEEAGIPVALFEPPNEPCRKPVHGMLDGRTVKICRGSGQRFYVHLHFNEAEKAAYDEQRRIEREADEVDEAERRREREAQACAQWPFPFSRAEFMSLTERDREHVIGYAAIAMNSFLRKKRSREHERQPAPKVPTYLRVVK